LVALITFALRVLTENSYNYKFNYHIENLGKYINTSDVLNILEKIKQIVSYKLKILLILVVVFFYSACTNPAPVPPPQPKPANKPPEILFLTSPQQINVSSSLEIKCIATDPDNDPLIYIWSTENGTVKGSGDTITWSAPDKAGSYIITVKVSDGKGGEAKGSVAMSVIAKPIKPPVIKSLTITPYRGQPVRFELGMKSVSIGRYTTSVIECDAEDPDGNALNYTWSTTAGTLKGEGKAIEYYSPVSGAQTVTVTVTNSEGSSIRQSVYINVSLSGGFLRN
jgi:hypothetical protein